MGFDLAQICCDSLSSSSSASKIFCNDNYNKCNPNCCRSCCGTSFLNDHTYSILKRVCHKIIKSYNRQQCFEKYTVFEGGNSIYQRIPDKQKNEDETEYDKDRSNRDERLDLKAANRQHSKKKDDGFDSLDIGTQKQKTNHSDKVKTKSMVKSTNEKKFGNSERADEFDSLDSGTQKQKTNQSDKVKNKSIVKGGNEHIDNVSVNNKKGKKDRSSFEKDDIVKDGEVGGDKNQLDSTRIKKKSIKAGRGTKELKAIDGLTSEREGEMDGKNKRNNAPGKKGVDTIGKEIVIENSRASEKKKRRDEKNQIDIQKVPDNIDKEKVLKTDKENGQVEKNKLSNSRGKKGTENVDKDKLTENAQTPEKEKGRSKQGDGNRNGSAKVRKSDNGKKGALDEENRIVKRNQKPLEKSEEKDIKQDKDKGVRAKTNKIKKNSVDETDLNAIPFSGKTSTGKKAGNDKTHVTQYQQGQITEKGKALNVDKSLNNQKLGKKSNRDIDSTKVDQMAGKGDPKSKSGKNINLEVGLSYQPKMIGKKIKAEDPSRNQYIGKQKPHRKVLGKISISKMRKRNMESKIRHNKKLSSRNGLFPQRPCRGDEVRVCDILRVQLEDRDLSRCIPCKQNCSRVCRCCMPICRPFVC